MVEAARKKGARSRNTSADASTGLRALVCQLGAREHYVVARCLAKSGLLACLATDYWSSLGPPKGRLFRHFPKVILSAMARCHPELSGDKVVCFPSVALFHYGTVLFGAATKYDTIAKLFSRYLQSLAVPHSVFFGYSYESLETLRHERRNGVFTILCQTDPGAAHYKMVKEEQAKWPEYVKTKDSFWSRQRFERLREEWEIADVIVVNSEWTRDSIIAEGAQASKIEILPLAYEPEGRGRGGEGNGRGTVVSEQWSVNSPLRVLYLGNVALAKGVQYLVEAARLLANQPVQFFVGGSIYISSSIIQSGPKNIRWLGRIPRSQTGEVYSDCDIFVFPTLSDGFGLTQLEALAHGLPVITTPNCGRVVEDRVSGFIVPPRDPRALAEAILRFVRNPELARTMAPRCHEAVKAFSVDVYGRRLLAIIKKHMPHR